VQQERAKTLVEMAEISAFFYRDFDGYDETAAKKNLRTVAIEPLTLARKVLAELVTWTPENLHEAVVYVAESLDLKLGKVAQPLRVAISGRAASPGIDVTLHLVGRDACLRRIDRALDYIGERMEEN
jgi:glutamyl-tRNA synthetase